VGLDLYQEPLPLLLSEEILFRHDLFEPLLEGPPELFPPPPQPNPVDLLLGRPLGITGALAAWSYVALFPLNPLILHGISLKLSPVLSP